MRELLHRNPLLVALAAAAVALLVVIGLETGFGSRLAPSIPTGMSRPAAPPESKLLPPLAAASPEQLYPEMAARPLFVPLRRPAPPAEPVAQSTLKRGQYVLQGVTIAGDTRIALLREKSTGRIHRIEKGHEINGAKLAEVTPESVTLAQGSEQEVLPLQVTKAVPGAGAPQLGPFGPATGAPGQPVHVAPQNPLAPGAAAGQPTVSDFGPRISNPSAQTLPQATTAPMTPEELLARRRARRAQQTQ